jgi:uncharacterized protein
VVSRQAGKVTAEFAANLQRALNGEPPAAAGPVTGRQGILRPRTAHGPVTPLDGQTAPAARSGDPWAKAAVALSGASVALSVVIMIRQRRGQ